MKSVLHRLVAQAGILVSQTPAAVLVFRNHALVVLALTLVAFSASANPIFGAPSDFFVGCDSPLGGRCDVSLDEAGNASANFHSFFLGGVPGDNNLHAVITHVASESNPAWVDSLGNPLEVTTYNLKFNGPNPSVGTGLFPGAVGLCDFGVTADGLHCTGPNGDVKGDVLIFRPNPDGTNTINFLSDNLLSFPFLTDFNVLEVGIEGHPEEGPGINGALYRALGNEGGGEDVFYNVRSDPEPATLALLAVGLAGLGFSRRKQ